jgi:HSP20 family protein
MFFVPVSRQTQDFARRLDRLFASAAHAEAAAARTPVLDLAETDSAYAVTLDMPGVAKEDIEVSVEGRRVNVQAKASAATAPQDGGRIVYRERPAARYARQFTLPQEVDASGTVATLAQGVLTLSLPKRSARQAAKITIN